MFGRKKRIDQALEEMQPKPDAFDRKLAESLAREYTKGYADGVRVLLRAIIAVPDDTQPMAAIPEQYVSPELRMWAMTALGRLPQGDELTKIAVKAVDDCEKRNRNPVPERFDHVAFLKEMDM